MTQLTESQANAELGGLTALAKAQAGRVLQECASTAVFLFGGKWLYSKWARGDCRAYISFISYISLFNAPLLILPRFPHHPAWVGLLVEKIGVGEERW